MGGLYVNMLNLVNSLTGVEIHFPPNDVTQIPQELARELERRVQGAENIRAALNEPMTFFGYMPQLDDTFDISLCRLKVICTILVQY